MKILGRVAQSVYRLTTGWTVRGSNPGGEEIFRHVQTGPGAHPASCTMNTGSFPGVNCGRGVLLTTHPLLPPRSWKSTAIPLPTLWATTGSVTGLLYLLLWRLNCSGTRDSQQGILILFSLTLSVSGFMYFMTHLASSVACHIIACYAFLGSKVETS